MAEEGHQDTNCGCTGGGFVIDGDSKMPQKTPKEVDK